MEKPRILFRYAWINLDKPRKRGDDNLTQYFFVLLYVIKHKR
jgi:hypothetical protein